MTRATLLHALDRPTALGPAEVRELEQLAQAFPYCQTAHLLLAKAAHDQGTMLAGQRLRRAATYAADRTLLRRLIEQVEPAIQAEPVLVAAPIEKPPAAPEELATRETTVAVQQIAPTVPIETVPLPPIAIAPPTEVQPAEFAPTPAPEAAPIETAPVTTASAVPALAEPVAVAATFIPEPALPVAADTEAPVEAIPEPLGLAVVAPIEPLASAEAKATGLLAEEEITQVEVTPEPEAAPLVEEAALPALIDQEGAEISPTISTVESSIELPASVVNEPIIPEETEELTVAVAGPEIEEDLPAQAPAIRPPVEVGEARFEFGLAEAALPAVSTYELPGLIDEWAAAAVTLSMGSPNLLAAPALAEAPAAPAFTPAAFTGDAAVGYAFGESSRLGLSMQLLDLLTARAETAESSTAVVAAAQPPATALPPIGTFFEPDPLLLDHWATHRPPSPALPSSLDLINNFLKRQPRLTRPGMLPPSPTAQADLSVRSTRAEPDLASETLARILVRQGKPLRAIEIYEKLMVKQPEKTEYFAAQIEALRSYNASI